MQPGFHRIIVAGTALSLGALCLGRPLAIAADKAADPATERARKQVRMLDDLYKTAVVLITKHYVNTEQDLPAGSAAKALFAAMKDKGWHEVRLIDGTGQPVEETNEPKDDFEKGAIKQLKSGKDYVDEVTTLDGVRVLRAATAVPVVMEKCIMCHEHYRNAKPGEAVGALVYKLKIE